MSMEAAGGGTGTIIPPYDRHLGGDDGSGNARDWDGWEAQMAATRDMAQAPSLSRPEGGRAADFRHDTPFRLGGMSLGAFSPEAAINRGMPRVSMPPTLGRIALPRQES